MGDFNLDVDEVREWMSIAAPGAMTLDVGPTCFGGGAAKPWTIDFGVFSKSARFLVKGAEACLASLPTHRPVDFQVSVNGLDAEVWAKPKVGTAPTEQVFGPMICAREEAQRIAGLVDQMEKDWPGHRIIKERSDTLEEYMSEA